MEGTEEKKKEYYPSGELWKKYSVDSDGNRHGTFRMYWPDGSKKAVCNYVHGVLCGTYVDFYRGSDVIRLGVMYDDYGCEEGVSEAYWPNGNLEYEITYVGGVEHGPYKLYWPNGQLNIDCNMVHGVEHGDYTIYKEDGSYDVGYVVENGKAVRRL
jgi:antitoxin component YwqK of YwqJK toxin-antitoxin module